jgi:PAS domain S-box-containing protein
LATSSFRPQLAALVLAIAIPLVALHVYDVLSDARAARVEARETTLSAARLAAQSVQRDLDRRRWRLEALASRPLVRALDPARCDPVLVAATVLDPAIANVETYDADGHGVCSAVPLPAAQAPVWRSAAPSREAVSSIAEHPVLGRPVIALDAPIRDAGGAVVGRARLVLDLGAIASAVDGMDPPGGGWIVVLDDAGRVVTGTGRVRASPGTPYPGSPVLPLDGAVVVQGKGATEELVATADVAGTPWHVHVASPSAAVGRRAAAALQQDLALVAAAVVLVLGAAVSLGRRVARPVSALERRLALVERGLAGASFPVTLVRADGSVVYANDAAARALRSGREDLLASRMSDWDEGCPPERWADTWLGIREAGSIRVQTQHRRRDGTTVPVEVHLEHVVFDGEEFAFAFARDLSERQRAEEALRRAQDQFLQSQKMEAVGRLAGGVAHDFNNLLTVILSCAQSLEDALPAGDRRRPEAEEIGRAGRTAAGLTRQLLAFSRKQVIAPKVLRVGELIAATDSMLRRLIGEHVALDVSGTDVPWRVRVDPAQLEQVLLNLAVNARDAMPSGGRLGLSVALRQLSGALVDGGATVPPGRWVVIEVSDTGVGMDEETRRHAFEPFYSTKPQGKGTGLGLPTVYGVVRQAGGHVALESAPERGTTFRIYLPEVDEAPTRAAAPSLAARAAPEATLLVVEDDGPLRSIMARALSDAGYRVIAAESGPDALRAAAGHSGDIDLLLTDVIMPGMNGRELAERLAAQRPATPALFLSGYTDDILGPQGVLEPGVHLLQKPFTPAELLAAVGKRLGAAA